MKEQTLYAYGIWLPTGSSLVEEEIAKDTLYEYCRDYLNLPNWHPAELVRQEDKDRISFKLMWRK